MTERAGNPWAYRDMREERMDQPDCPEPELYCTLKRFSLLNRLVTRYRYLLTYNVLRTMRRQPDRAYRLADLGAGGCDIARWLIRQSRRQNLRLKILAIERDPRIVRYAVRANREFPEIEVIQGDALDSATWRRPDFVFANHLLHHLPDTACRDLLQKLEHAGIQHYLLSDIIRSRWTALGYSLLVAPFRHGNFLLEDGRASIRRGFTRAELYDLIRQANLESPPRVRTLFPSRCVLEKRPAGTGR